VRRCEHVLVLADISRYTDYFTGVESSSLIAERARQSHVGEYLRQQFRATEDLVGATVIAVHSRRTTPSTKRVREKLLGLVES
jgi:hypothetical protein